MKQKFISNYLWKLKAKCKETQFKTLKKFFVLIYQVSQYLSGSWIAWESNFKNMPCLPHGIQGIFISKEAQIGYNCVIFQQVTIGSSTLVDSDKIGSPIIGNNCYIGAGAKIIGKIIIGDNVRIGANCVVYKSVPDNSVVTSGEQKIINKEKLNNRFYKHDGKWVFYHNGYWNEETDDNIIKRLDTKI
jgi:serine O-acetyltransferase